MSPTATTGGESDARPRRWRPRPRLGSAALVPFRTKLAASAVVAIAVLSFTVAETLASFNAEAKNAANNIASGTLVLSDTKTGGSTCYSTAGGTTNTNVNGACDNLFGLTTKKPGDAMSSTLTLKNEGSVAASALKLYTSACTDSNAAGETYHGTGSLCGVMQLDIQQYSDSAFTTPSACIYGGGTATTCDWSDTAKTLGTFTAAHTGAANAIAVGSGLAAGASVYVKVSFQIPSTADNTIQVRQAAADLTWHIDQ